MSASLEVIILGLFSGLRPGTSIAAVLALLKARRPARGLLFFTVAGFVSTWATGVLVVLGFHGANVALGDSTLASVLDIALGSAALGLVAGMHRGWVKPAIHHGPSAPSTGRAARLTARLHDPSAGIAAATGVLTHIPGVVYLLALNAIAAPDPPVVHAGLQVTIYCTLWFLVPLASLGLLLVRPGAALRYIETATAWVRRHEQAVLSVGMLVVGGYFVVKGTVSLLT